MAEEIKLLENEETSLKDFLVRYLFYWKWFLLSVIVSLVFGFIYLRYQLPIYEASSLILIKDDKKASSISNQVSDFEDLGLFKNKKNIEDEIEILKSRELMSRVVKELNLNITYYSFGRPIVHERFLDSPISATILENDSVISIASLNCKIIPISNKKFNLIIDDDDKNYDYFFDDTLNLSLGKITFHKTAFFNESSLNKEFIVSISPVEASANFYLSSLQINSLNKSTSVINISLQNSIPEKAIAIIDNLIKQYNTDGINDKNKISQNTSNFINDRIKYISLELADVESISQNYKIKNKLTDIESESKLVLESVNDREKNSLDANTQLSIYDFIIEYLTKHENIDELIPSNIGTFDPSVSFQINDYNKLVVNRNRILKISSEKNPIVQNMEEQLIELRKSINESIQTVKNTLKIKVNELTRNQKETTSKIALVPVKERELRNIQRQQQIKEALYLYLLQKREETNLALAVTVSDFKIIDKTFCNGEIISPNKRMIYLTFFLIGFLIPILVLFIISALDTKVHGKKEIDMAGLQYIGDIPISNNKENLVVLENRNSKINEAFGILRSNVEFLNASITSNTGKEKIIFVTSTIGKEGKSFISLNLAASFAISGKKVLLIGTDLRNPKLLKYMNLSEKEGLTNLLTDFNLKIKDVILEIPEITTLNILPSGPIPPNPQELLMSNRMDDIFKYARENYEYIIVDTAPVGLVADTLMISKFADSTIFVARADFLDKRLLRIAVSLSNENRLPNLACLINGVNFKKGYGYGYGYGYSYGYGAYGYKKS